MGRFKDQLIDDMDNGGGPGPCDQCRGTGIEDEVRYPTRDCLACDGSGTMDPFMDGLCRNGKNMKDCDCC